MNIELPQKLILFNLDNKPFGLDVTAVQEILPQVAVRQVPRSAEYIQGVFDFRGKIIPLINLRQLLSLAHVSHIGNVIVVRHHSQLMGLIVDKVLAVLTDQDQIKQVEWKQLTADTYVQGFVEHKEMQVAVLNLAELAAIIGEKGDNDVSCNA